MPVKSRKRLLLLAGSILILAIFAVAYLRFRAARTAVQSTSPAVVGRIVRMDGVSIVLREVGPDGVALSGDDVLEPFFLSQNLTVSVQTSDDSGSFVAGTSDSLAVDAWIAVQSTKTTSRGKEVDALSVLPSSTSGVQQ